MSKSEPSKELRSLGLLERFHVARNAIGFYNNVAVTGRYRIPTVVIEEVGSIEGLLYSILRRIIPRHPSLGLGIVNEESKDPSWKRLDQIELKEIVQIVEVKDFNTFLEEEHSKPFDRVTELPLWRLVAGHATPKQDSADDAEDVDLVVGFFFHHAIGDGGSGAAFHMDFSELLNSNDHSRDDDSVDSVVEVPHSSLLPSLEELKTLTLSYWKIASVLYNVYFPSKNTSLWTGNPVSIPASGRPRTRAATLNIPAAAVAKINLTCRENSVTVTPYLAVTIAQILPGIFPDYTEFTSNIPISFRRFTGVGIRDMVDQFSTTTLLFSTVPKSGYFRITSEEELNCDVVRACKAQITKAASSPADSSIALLRLVNDNVDYLKKQVGKKRGHSIEISNLGLVNLQDDTPGSKSKCTSLTVSQSANVTGGAFTIGIAAVKNGDLSIAVTWQEGIVNEEDAKRFISRLEARLLRVAM